MAFILLIRRNLISIPILDRLGYTFHFGNCKDKLYQDSLLIGNGMVCGNIYRLELYGLFSVSVSLVVNTVNSTKRLRLDERSFTLWHKRLGHICR